MTYLKFSENLRKCFEIFGKFRDVIANVRNGSKELRASNDGTVEWNTTRSILSIPVAYRRIYATVILASDWLYFSRYGIKYNTIQRNAKQP